MIDRLKLAKNLERGGLSREQLKWFAEVVPPYGNAMEVLGEHVDEIRADPTASSDEIC
jgi:hypothetical protein